MPTATRSWVRAAALGAAMLLFGCSETSGEYVLFPAAVSGSSEAAQPFTTSAGWLVELQEAHAVFGPLYLYESLPDPEPVSALTAVLDLFRIPEAHAHAVVAGRIVIGEVLQHYAVDLLGEPTELGSVFGVAGTCSDAELRWYPPGGIDSAAGDADFAALDGQMIRLVGRATPTGDTDAQPVEFVASVTIADEDQERIVRNIPADARLRDASPGEGHLRIELDPATWLDVVDFSTLNAFDDDGRAVFTSDTSAWGALMYGLRATWAYDIRWVEEAL